MAAATGAIAGAVVVLGRRSIYDWPTAAIGIAISAPTMPMSADRAWMSLSNDNEAPREVAMADDNR